jgi:DNA-binding response OmpR family regulator
MSGLDGKRILVAEDEYLIATDMVGSLAGVGAVVLGPAPTVEEAAQLAAAPGAAPDAALLDVNLSGQMIWPVVEALAARGVPVLLATGYDSDAIPRAYAHLPRCEKPVDMQVLLRRLRSCLETARTGP